MSTRLLIIADNAVELRRLKSAFVLPEFLARSESEGKKAWRCALAWRPHLVILDLESAQWRELLRMVKAGDAAIPIFLLYGPHQEEEMIAALQEGAASALARPFSSAELLARVRALTRYFRNLFPEDSILRFGALTLDLQGRRVCVEDRPVKLTPKEFAVLKVLAQSAGKVLARRQILESVWGYEASLDARNVDSRIFRLRKKLGAKGSPALETVSGQGYCLRP